MAVVSISLPTGVPPLQFLHRSSAPMPPPAWPLSLPLCSSRAAAAGVDGGGDGQLVRAGLIATAIAAMGSDGGCTISPRRQGVGAVLASLRAGLLSLSLCASVQEVYSSSVVYC